MLFLLPLLFLLFALASCGVEEQPPQPHEPFSSLLEGADGSAIELRGLRTGHVAGRVSEVEVMLRNGSEDRPWHGTYCLLLVDKLGTVAQLGTRRYSVEAGQSEGWREEVKLPEDLENEAYGLALVVPSFGSVANTIYMGHVDTDGLTDPGPWSLPTTCP